MKLQVAAYANIVFLLDAKAKPLATSVEAACLLILCIFCGFGLKRGTSPYWVSYAIRGVDRV